jgi:poly(A) polymerase
MNADANGTVDPDAPLEPEPLAPDIDTAKLDADGLKVLRHLRRNGHQAYFVGGCVRDLLLSQKPKDFDIATSAAPEEVRRTFRNCRLIGRRFRLAHVYFHGHKVIEVATFRKNPVEEVLAETPQAAEGDLLISEDNVFGTAEEDARRRDFTINGLFYDVALGEVIDYVGGRADLTARVIRTIGPPDIRIREDPVRILRAIRFAAKLDLQIEPATWDAMRAHVSELSRCAPARVFEEILRLLRSGASRRAIELLREAGALAILLPSVDAFLAAAPETEAVRFFGLLAFVDERLRAGLPTDDSILLGALLLRIVRAAPQKDSPLTAIEPLLNELVRVARLPRRIAEGTRLLVLSQGALLGERRRRGSPTRFMRSPHFDEALLLMEANARVSGEGEAALQRWKERRTAMLASGEAPASGQRRGRGGPPGPTSGPVAGAPSPSVDATPSTDDFTFEGPGLL